MSTGVMHEHPSSLYCPLTAAVVCRVSVATAAADALAGISKLNQQYWKSKFI